MTNTLCVTACDPRCKEGFVCDSELGVCRAMTCSPECPDTHACIEVAGSMTCVPACSPKCKAGYACLLNANPPVCVQPGPKEFTLFISMQERHQSGGFVEDRFFNDLDAPVGFLGAVVSGDRFDACNPNAANASNPHGAAAPFMESLVACAAFSDSRGKGGVLGQFWREVHVDVGAAVEAGQFSGSADVQIFARTVHLKDASGAAMRPRPLDIFVALRHKATGATLAESYATIGTLGMDRPNASRELWCYHGADALSAIVKVSTPTPDSITYALEIVKPFMAAASAGAADAAALAATAAPAPAASGDGGVGWEAGELDARIAAVRKAYADERMAVEERERARLRLAERRMQKAGGARYARPPPPQEAAPRQRGPAAATAQQPTGGVLEPSAPAPNPGVQPPAAQQDPAV